MGARHQEKLTDCQSQCDFDFDGQTQRREEKRREEKRREEKRREEISQKGITEQITEERSKVPGPLRDTTSEGRNSL
jgi:hypothetical protein